MLRILATAGNVLHLPRKEAEKHLVITDVSWCPVSNAVLSKGKIG